MFTQMQAEETAEQTTMQFEIADRKHVTKVEM
jgi:hypothetical protein